MPKEYDYHASHTFQLSEGPQALQAWLVEQQSLADIGQNYSFESSTTEATITFHVTGYKKNGCPPQ